MSVIGIITQNNNIIETEENINKYQINLENIIIINKENAENIQHVKFDIVVIYEEIKPTSTIRKVLDKAKYLIINADYKNNLELINQDTEAYVITYGFKSKSTITIISNENDEIILEIQREIEDINKQKIEPQEIKMERKFGKKHIYEEIAMEILKKIAKI